MQGLPPLSQEKKMKVLDVGCGKAKRHPDALTVDIFPESKPDIIHNLNIFPWPFEENSFDFVYMNDVVEHLDNIVGSMEEVFRILKPNGRVQITTPHFSSSNSYTDPTHKYHLGVRSFDMFTGGNNEVNYEKTLFKKCQSEIVFYPSLFSRVVRRLANTWPDCYERRWAWIFPAWFVSIELEAVKK